MIRKIFQLWHNHTIGCARALTVLLIPAAFSSEFGFMYACFLMIYTLIINTGYRQHWSEEGDNDGNV